MTQLTFRASRPYVGIFFLAVIQPSCTGTEADNPFTDPVTTSLCKGEGGYVPLVNPREPLVIDKDSLKASPAPVRSEPVPPFQSELSSLSEIPVWLECVEWDLREGIFDYQIANFSGGCAVDWRGGGEVTDDGGIKVELRNEQCAVAGCGSCLYDMKSKGNIGLSEANEAVSFELILENCEGESTGETSWSLPVHEKSHGILCGKADRWGAEKSTGNSASEVEVDLYAPCGDGSDQGFEPRICADALTCINGSCVPSCMSDGDCPLAGALTCQDGYCQL